MRLVRWFRFRHAMREVLSRGPVLGAGLICPDLGLDHEWAITGPESHVCIKCGSHRRRFA